MTRPVTPAGRRRDRFALALVLAGVILAGIPALRLAEMAEGRGMIQGAERAPRNQERVQRLVLFTTLGAAAVAAGVVAGLWSFARHASGSDHRAQPAPANASTPPDAEADHS